MSRSKMIRRAASLPKGSRERRALLQKLAANKVAYPTERDVALYNKLTGQNNHVGASRALAKALGNFLDEKKLEHLEGLRDLYGHMPSELEKLKREIDKPMFAEAKRITMADGRSLYDHLN